MLGQARMKGTAEGFTRCFVQANCRSLLVFKRLEGLRVQLKYLLSHILVALKYFDGALIT